MYKDGDFNFKFVGTFYTIKFREKILSIPEEEWDKFTPRQGGAAMYGNYRSPHTETRTIPLLYDENFLDIPSEYEWYSLFKEDIEEVRAYLLDKYKSGNIPRIILTKLLAERNILPHVDTGEQLLKCKRHHIPVITNGLVMFHVGDESVNMKTGEVWEINNANRHYVKNYSVEDRIHIIVDWDINLEY